MMHHIRSQLITDVGTTEPGIREKRNINTQIGLHLHAIFANLPSFARKSHKLQKKQYWGHLKTNCSIMIFMPMIHQLLYLQCGR